MSFQFDFQGVKIWIGDTEKVWIQAELTEDFNGHQIVYKASETVRNYERSFIVECPQILIYRLVHCWLLNRATFHPWSIQIG